MTGDIISELTDSTFIEIVHCIIYGNIALFYENHLIVERDSKAVMVLLLQ